MTEDMKKHFDAAEKAMKKAVAHLQEEFAAIRAGRANPGVLNKVSVDYYGTKVPVQQLANCSVDEGRTLVISPFDPTTIRAISKAILASDIGITPIDDGKTIRMTFPQPTEQQRKEIAKAAKKTGDDTKVVVRNARADLLKQIKNMKKNSEITEDDQKNAEKKVQTLTDRFIEEIDKMVTAKEKEIMTI